MNFILQWIDLIWLPLGLYAVHKRHRWWVLGFMASCMLMMRMQVEAMSFIGYEYGLIGLLEMSVFMRGLMVYGLFYVAFLVTVHFSAKSEGVVIMAGSIGMFFLAFFVSTLVMVL